MKNDTSYVTALLLAQSNIPSNHGRESDIVIRYISFVLHKVFDSFLSFLQKVFESFYLFYSKCRLLFILFTQIIQQIFIFNISVNQPASFKDKYEYA